MIGRIGQKYIEIEFQNQNSKSLELIIFKIKNKISQTLSELPYNY